MIQSFPLEIDENLFKVAKICIAKISFTLVGNNNTSTKSYFFNGYTYTYIYNKSKNLVS